MHWAGTIRMSRLPLRSYPIFTRRPTAPRKPAYWPSGRRKFEKATNNKVREPASGSERFFQAVDSLSEPLDAGSEAPPDESLPFRAKGDARREAEVRVHHELLAEGEAVVHA